MDFNSLTSLVQETAAGHFGQTPDAKQIYAWFPEGLEESPDEVEGFTIPLGKISVGSLRARSRDPLEAVERTEQLESFSLSRAIWYAAYGDALPLKSMTCFIIGPASEDDPELPDPDRVVRCTVESEVRIAGGIMEIDGLRHPDFFADEE